MIMYMIDLLDLPGLQIMGRNIDPYDLICYLDVEFTGKHDRVCPKCGKTEGVIGHAARPTTFSDLPIREYRTKITLKFQRLRCVPCLTVFKRDMPWVDPVRKMTTRCVRWIQERSLHDRFADIAYRVGVDETTVRNIANDYFALLNDRHIPQVPQWLGIDEIALGGKYRCVLTDIRQHRIVDILPDRQKLTVSKWLWKHQWERQSPNPKLVTMDMWKDFRAAVRDLFPAIPIIVDKFHVIRMANEAIDEVRIRLSSILSKKERAKWFNNRGLLRARNHIFSQKSAARMRLEAWLDNNPELATAYELKEKFFEIYDQTRRYVADTKLDDWRDEVLKAKMEEPFSELLGALYGKEKKPQKPPKRPCKPKLEKEKEPKHWRNLILAYFDHPEVTNAYTESVNNIIRSVDRMGRGYDFEVLRARVLFRQQFNYMQFHSKRMKELASVPNAPEWLKQSAAELLTDDISFIEKSHAASGILTIQSILVMKYGDLCPGCGGHLQRKLLEFNRTLPVEFRALGGGAFHLSCKQCKKPFSVSGQETPLQPVDAETRSGASALKPRHIQKRAMDLHHLRDLSVLPPEPKPRRRKRSRNPPRPVATPKPQPDEETYTLDPDAGNIT